MGDRAMAEIRLAEGSLYVYVHWHGQKLPEMARAAVNHASVRLGDEPYWTRMVVDQLIKDGRDEETGFGLLLKPDAEDEYNDGKPSVVIHASDGRVEEVGEEDD